MKTDETKPFRFCDYCKKNNLTVTFQENSNYCPYCLQLRTTISRRDFLKLVGFGIAVIASSSLYGGGLPASLLKKLFTPASAQTSLGSWSTSSNTTIVAMHVALLPSGKIFYLAGSGNHDPFQNGPYEARILDLNTGLEKNLVQSEDLFCIGLSALSNGNVLLAGGTLRYDNNPNNCNGKLGYISVQTLEIV